jgi:formylglycine-generating enzyme required for sulfatase activity
MTRVETFCIDVYEAALVKVSDGLPWSPYFNPGVVPVRAVSVKGAVPQGYIDQVQAEAACLEAGKRLCSDDEWLRACRGASNHIYPYGNSLVPGRCNDHRATHPAVEYFGTTASWIFSEIDHPCLDQLPDSLDPAGSNPQCVTDEGAFDMMGNLHEWTADPNGTFRGGFFVDTVKNGSGCLYVTTAHDVLHWDYSTGFRCCADL